VQWQLRILGNSVSDGAEVPPLGYGGEEWAWDVMVRMEAAGINDPSNVVDYEACDKDLG